MGTVKAWLGQIVRATVKMFASQPVVVIALFRGVVTESMEIGQRISMNGYGQGGI